MKTLIQMVLIWFCFWVLGLPDYYQQYPSAAIGIATVLLSVLISLAARTFIVASGSQP